MLVHVGTCDEENIIPELDGGEVFAPLDVPIAVHM